MHGECAQVTTWSVHRANNRRTPSDFPVAGESICAPGRRCKRAPVTPELLSTVRQGGRLKSLTATDERACEAPPSTWARELLSEQHLPPDVDASTRLFKGSRHGTDGFPTTDQTQATMEQVSEAAREAGRRAVSFTEDIADAVRERPFTALAVAAGLAFAVGALW
jgi:hypothetical protein